MSVANTLAYYVTVATAVKSFQLSALGVKINMKLGLFGLILLNKVTIFYRVFKWSSLLQVPVNLLITLFIGETE